ncbi:MULTISPECIES: acyl-CoA dehydrogenase [Ralstonia solanacearum species complex]|uniref:Acyl-coa dehydrogenase protein n=4 Tax=Ralstonia solanacearum species complex TaxID=3116862 RepID=A0A7U7PR22_RALSL|nr:acyl-CoA dehydrogenase [Ralstonia solanacearum]ALF89851.1 putative acyl-CoA dehydrogenase fadE25 [Ralstonia solanacearum]ATI29348.1 acyl-CoA dehydrogenase [Ralstonia solanacearum]EAP73069.1 Acyl-CoA dehydrogenase, short-chain specific [Ralstonia solanacearum UW551]MBB6584925.1 acyl-CoA dehydrogenase [Ralstonia solanacearum]MDB0520726.1 acyl-CoA dehydrogenase [Ralstonia solanacearum]
MIALEAYLGSPHDPRQLFSHAARLADDEAQRYPSDAFGSLDAWGMHRYYVPARLGGQLHRLDRLGALMRTVSRRDLTVSIGHAVTLLGAAGIWLAGDPVLQRRVADRILDGERVSLGLTEHAHGGDLLAVETQAEWRDGAYVLNGEKWLVNGMSRNAMGTVFVRTDPSGGPRGFSLFLYDKRASAAGFTNLPAIATLGVRGADISGLRFEHAIVPEDARVGAPGSGLETVLRILQVTRSLCGSLSLGAAETCLAVTLAFAARREVLGRTVLEIPQSRRLITEAWADLLVCDSLTEWVLRAFQVVPQQGSVHSAVVKYLVPHLCERLIGQLAVVLGARSYLRDEDGVGIFQKMMRDNLLIGLFDGSSVVNLHSLSFQLRGLMRPRAATPGEDEAGLSIADLRTALPDFDWPELALSASGEDALMRALPASLDALQTWARQQDDSSSASLCDVAQRLRVASIRLAEQVAALTPAQISRSEPVLFDLARHYCLLSAASALLLNWRANREYEQPAACLQSTDMLLLLLSRLDAHLTGTGHALPEHVYATALAALQARAALGDGLGLMPVDFASCTFPTPLAA